MPQQLLLEGSDLEALILRAREEYGPGARVVRAEKVRSGGFLGFFTREHFELTVEISDADIAEAAATRAPREIVRSRAAEDSALAAEIEDARAARESMLSGALGGATPDRALAAPARDVDPAPIAVPAPARDVAEFDRLVLSLTEEAGAAEDAPVRPKGASAPASAHAPAIGRPFVPATFPVADRPTPSSPVEASRRVGAASSHEAGAAPADGDARVRETAGRTRTLANPASGDGFDGGAADDREFRSGTNDDATPAERPATPQRLEGVVLHRWGVFTDVASAVATHCTVPALLALGVPLRCVEDYADLGSPVPLLDVVARFGTPPVRRPEPGDLIVIAGPAEHALAVAKQLAGWVGLAHTAVVLAGEIDAIRGHGRRIRDEAQARTLRARAEKVGQLGEPLIVAFGVAPGRRGAASAAPMLAAFGADTAWAVADATKRPSTYEPAISLLASHARIDGLAAVNVADAQAPCAMLDASLPVAWMDGLPAAGLVWAALLGERIAAVD